jgi:RNA polymerase sigma-70 factor (sigma-E family)
MAAEELVVPAPAAHSDAVADFTAWVADHHRPLLDFAQLVAGDASTGEDLLQIALARAYLRWSKLSAHDEHPLGYVRRIIVNENASLWRLAWKRRERSTGSLPEAGTVDPASIDTTWAMVKALPARQRAAVALRFYADLSVTETAEMMGCSVGAVKTHTTRALAKLREALVEDGES